MTATTLRSAIHAGALVAALAAFLLLPLDPLWNGLAALAVWLALGVIGDTVFRRRATEAERRADLRDRVDNPPS